MSKLSPRAMFQKCNYCEETSFLCHPESRPLWMFLVGRKRPFHTRYYKYQRFMSLLHYLIWCRPEKDNCLPISFTEAAETSRVGSTQLPLGCRRAWQLPGKKPPRPPPCIKNKAHNAQQDMWDPPSHPYLPCPLPCIYFLTSKYMPAP